MSINWSKLKSYKKEVSKPVEQSNVEALEKEQKKTDQLCAKFICCDVFANMNQCRDNLSVYILPEACTEALLKSSGEQCPEFYSPKIEGLCFPPCLVDGNKCSGEILTVCENGSQCKIDCYNYCAQKAGFQPGRKVCGYSGKIGQDDCLCE